MRILNETFAAVAIALSLSATAFAENDKEKKEHDWGHVTGSFETNTNVYLKDAKTLATVPDGRFGSNNYLKVDYYNKRFSAGVQLEAYAPAAVGYPGILEKAALTNYYVAWTDKDFSVTAGTFYEQFGSGLLFRSWEDRALGLNNSIMGARVAYHFRDIVSVKALWGMPRFGMKFSDTRVKGADASFAISNLVGWQRVYLAVEGSVLDRYEKLSAAQEAEQLNPNRLGYSARLNFDIDGFFLKGEYVNSGTRYFDNLNYGAPGFEDDPKYLSKKGNAQLVEMGYTGRGLGVSLSLRRLEWMDARIVSDGGSPEVNMLNYVPALCTQYTYMLANLHPYGPRTGEIASHLFNSGEIGGQIDIFYKFIEEMMVQKRIEFWGEGILIYDYKRLNKGITRNYKGSVTTNVTGDYLLNTTGRSPQWNFCIPLSELQTNLAISSDQNNPDPTSFTGDPQRTL